MSQPEGLSKLKGHLNTVADLKAAVAVLGWDQETYMPDGASEARAMQTATLSRLGHETFTSDEVGLLLENLESSGLDGLSEYDRALIRITRKDFDRANRLSPQFVETFAKTTSQSLHAWRQARDASDFSGFAPYLGKIVDLVREKAELFGYESNPYDALLDEYEPDMTAAEVATVFSGLRDRLVPLVQSIASSNQVDDSLVRREMDTAGQIAFSMQVLRDVGYDLHRGRMDISTHPFTTSFGSSDVRITTRVDEHYFPTCIFGTLHEAGHGMYEQGISNELARTALSDGTSLGIHESQSRLWENQVGRSRSFWNAYLGDLKAQFPGVIDDATLDGFYPAINKVEPSLIRVEADEATYNLHVMVRFELELDLVNGRLEVNDLPDAWASRMEEYLGIRPETDAEGVLQDIHWSMGAIGYFPTYALGTLMSAQLYDAAEEAIPDLSDKIAAKEFGPLLDWLGKQVHQFGRARSASEILTEATGAGLTADNWLRYVEEKYAEIYRF